MKGEARIAAGQRCAGGTYGGHAALTATVAVNAGRRPRLACRPALTATIAVNAGRLVGLRDRPALTGGSEPSRATRPFASARIKARWSATKRQPIHNPPHLA